MESETEQRKRTNDEVESGETGDQDTSKKPKLAEDGNGNPEKNGNGTVKPDVEAAAKPAPAPPAEPELNPDAGILIVGGGTNWDLIGRSQLPKNRPKAPATVCTSNLWGPHVWKESIRVSSIASHCSACHSALITEDGRVMTWGRNDSGQLGLGDLDTRYTPTVVTALEEHNIVQIAVGKNHTLFLTDKGVVYSCGDNTMGQLGQGCKGKAVPTPTKIDFKGKPIVKMAGGGDFSMILDITGGLYSFGSPEYGQLGLNSDGKFLEKAGKVTFNCETSPRKISMFVEKNRGSSTPVKDVVITDMKCGPNHTVALDNKSRVFTWGFAGYGRLGHSETKDEMIPRQVKQLENLRFQCKKIAVGSSFCIAADNNRLAYFWGQTKMAGDATMYPKPLQDLCGWNIRAFACCNKSIVVAADESLISWGPSPTYGELMYGENRPKSSTVPQEIKPLEGIHINDVACGFGHTLCIARDLSPEERAKIAKLPKWG